MSLVLEYQDRTNTKKTILVLPVHVVSFGASDQADFMIDFDPSVLDQHFTIFGKEHRWVIEAVGDAPVFVNSQRVQHTSLGNGDEILVGNTRFTVRLEGIDTTPTVDPPIVTAVAANPNPIVFASRKLNAEMVEIQAVDAADRLLELVSKIHASQLVYLAVNQKRLAGVTIGNWQPETEDLFAQAPSEIREKNSLHVGTLDLKGTSEKELRLAMVGDAAILFMSNNPLPALLEKQKLGWAWFSRSSIFRQQITLGSESLAKILFAGINLVLVIPTDKRDVLMYCRAENKSLFELSK